MREYRGNMRIDSLLAEDVLSNSRDENFIAFESVFFSRTKAFEVPSHLGGKHSTVLDAIVSVMDNLGKNRKREGNKTEEEARLGQRLAVNEVPKPLGAAIQAMNSSGERASKPKSMNVSEQVEEKNN